MRSNSVRQSTGANTLPYRRHLRWRLQQRWRPQEYSLPGRVEYNQCLSCPPTTVELTLRYSTMHAQYYASSRERERNPCTSWKTYSDELSYYCELEGVMIRLDPLHIPATVDVARRPYPLGVILAIYTPRCDTHPGNETTVVA